MSSEMGGYHHKLSTTCANNILHCFITTLALALLLPFTIDSTNAEYLNVDDPKLLQIREHILRAYYLRPEPVDQCKQELHQSAIRLFTTAVSLKEQEEALADMQSSIVAGSDDFFVGLPETIAALASTKIKYMVYWEGLFINSATYRNPLSGRTITLHSMFSPDNKLSINYTEPETGGFMELVNCYPFPKWLSKYYESYAPKPIRLEQETKEHAPRNLFVRMSGGGIGGRFSEAVTFATNKWMHDLYRSNSVRKSLILRGFTTPTTTPDTFTESNYETGDASASYSAENLSAE